MEHTSKGMKLLAVADPFPASGGGCYRARKSLASYSLYGIKPYLLIPPINQGTYDAGTILELASRGVIVLGLTNVYSFNSRVLNRVRESLLPLLPRVFIHAELEKIPRDVNVVLSFHETLPSLWLASRVSSELEKPSAAVLQLPPYYVSKDRLQAIREAFKLYIDHLYGGNTVRRIIRYAYRGYYDLLDNALYKPKFKQILARYSLVVGISRSICVEMGLEDSSKTYCMDPGVTLDEDDLKLIRSIRERIKEKKNYVVFGGRPVAEKGIAEALIVFKKISNRFTDHKLYITGSIISNRRLDALKRLTKQLGIEDRVVFTGFLPREERLRIVAESRLVLYPSHVDAYSYAVAESLLLGTPIVAYSIPAIDIYYRGLEGVRVVKELDLEAMADESIDMLSRGNIKVEPPRLRSWDDIIREEVNLLEHVAETS